MKRIVFSLMLAVAIALPSCTESEAPMPTTVLEAGERGRADARALCEANYTAEKDLHAALLAVKSREWKLRRQGDSIAAGAYIDGFRNQLSETDRNLYNKVF